MTTLEFLNNNSSRSLDQTTWENEIIENNYDEDKNIVHDEFNDFGINGLFTNHEIEYGLEKYNKHLYNITIQDLGMDTIDKIYLKIKLRSMIHKLLLFSFSIRIRLKTRDDTINLLDTDLLDYALLSYFNKEEVNEEETTLLIPIMQFNVLKYGYLYRKQKHKQLNIIFENALSAYTKDVYYSNTFENVNIVFHGKKYYDFDKLPLNNNEYYKYMDINWFFTQYKQDGIKIKSDEITYQFIIFKLIKKFKSENELNEFVDNQPEVHEISFQYKYTVPWIYDLQYMKKVTLYGINMYILPLYPEFTNLDNIMYYIKHSNNGIYEEIDDYVLKIKTNIEDDTYNVYISFVGEYVT
jgi:hypothetical protein